MSWRVVINDSSNGGGNYYAIEDASAGRQVFRIEAGARTNALYVEADGDIGVGTSNPATDVEIKTGNTPTLRLCQDGSSGFTPQAWDVAGNETNFFIRDVTNGSTLPFRIRPGAPTSPLDIAANGNIGLGGTASSIAKLTVIADQNQIEIQDDNGNQDWRISANANFFIVEDETAGAIPFRIQAGAPDNLFRLTSAGQVQVNLAQVHPDYVFEEAYKLLSIEDHAAKMWDKKHLPAVGKGEYNEEGKSVLDIGSKTFGILEELEVAHIYIEQLNAQVTQQKAEMAQQRQQLDTLQAELAQLRAAVLGN